MLGSDQIRLCSGLHVNLTSAGFFSLWIFSYWSEVKGHRVDHNLVWPVPSGPRCVLDLKSELLSFLSEETELSVCVALVASSVSGRVFGGCVTWLRP